MRLKSKILYDGLIEVWEDGKIFRLKKDKKIEAGYGKCGCGSQYLSVAFTYKGIRRTELVHRLVAKAFIPNPLNLPEVNHIDRNSANNNATNLEWCTHKQNMQWSYKFIMKTRNKKLQAFRQAFNLNQYEMAVILKMDVLSYKKLEDGIVTPNDSIYQIINQYFKIDLETAASLFVTDVKIENRKNIVKDSIKLIKELKRNVNLEYEIYKAMKINWIELKNICHRSINKRIYICLYDEIFKDFCTICIFVLKKYGYQNTNLYERPQNIQIIRMIASVLNTTVEELFPLSGEK